MSSLQQRIAATLRADVAGMHAYAIQASDGLIKLDAMENPFSLPPALQQALGERLGRAAINRYPQASVVALAEELTAYVGLPQGCRLMLGNGSDELIDLLSVACDVPGATILAPVPGFVMYAMSAQLRGLQFVGVPLTADFELDEAAMLAAIEQHRQNGVAVKQIAGRVVGISQIGDHRTMATNGIEHRIQIQRQIGFQRHANEFHAGQLRRHRIHHETG